jgi:hypothetical protein
MPRATSRSSSRRAESIASSFLIVSSPPVSPILRFSAENVDAHGQLTCPRARDPLQCARPALRRRRELVVLAAARARRRIRNRRFFIAATTSLRSSPERFGSFIAMAASSPR